MSLRSRSACGARRMFVLAVGMCGAALDTGLRPVGTRGLPPSAVCSAGGSIVHLYRGLRENIVFLRSRRLGLLDYGKKIIIIGLITIILVNNEITIIQTIIFEFDNMINLFSMSLTKNTVTENFAILP